MSIRRKQKVYIFITFTVYGVKKCINVGVTTTNQFLDIIHTCAPTLKKCLCVGKTNNGPTAQSFIYIYTYVYVYIHIY